VRLRAFRLLRKTRRGCFEPLALALEFEQVAVMQQAIEQWRDDDGVAE